MNECFFFFFLLLNISLDIDVRVETLDRKLVTDRGSELSVGDRKVCLPNWLSYFNRGLNLTSSIKLTSKTLIMINK